NSLSPARIEPRKRLSQSLAVRQVVARDRPQDRTRLLRTIGMENLITVNEDFLARHCDQLRALAGACLGLSPASDLDPSDIVQATLVKAYPARARFQGRTKPEQVAWLRTILSTTVANALRWRGHRKVERSTVSGTGSDGSFTFTDQGPADGRPG